MAELDFFMMVALLVLTPLSLVIARFIAKRSYTLFPKADQGAWSSNSVDRRVFDPGKLDPVL